MESFHYYFILGHMLHLLGICSRAMEGFLRRLWLTKARPFVWLQAVACQAGADSAELCLGAVVVAASIANAARST